jgi:DhnA family fructose-bisphosphate aldolase class Ia
MPVIVRKDNNVSGSAIRLGRLFQRQSRRSFIVALDHGLTLGVPQGAEDLPAAVDRSMACQPDGVLLSPGMARAAADRFTSREAPALLIRIDFILNHPFVDDLGEQYRVLISPTEAASLGADAVTMFLMVGASSGELFADNAAAVAKAAQEAHRIGLPLIVEAVLWGSRIEDKKEADRLAFGCRVAAELGADAIKTEYTGDAASMAKIIQGCGLPVLVLGGAKGSLDTLYQGTRSALDAGARGVIIGRNIWQADDPAAVSGELRRIIHG